MKKTESIKCMHCGDVLGTCEYEEGKEHVLNDYWCTKTDCKNTLKAYLIVRKDRIIKDQKETFDLILKAREFVRDHANIETIDPFTFNEEVEEAQDANSENTQ